MRPASRNQIVRWDDLVAANPGGGQALQTRAWGEFKRRWGWQPSYWIAQSAGEDVAVLFLRRHFVGFGDVWYSPKGPGVRHAAGLTDVLSDRTPMRGAFVIKVEPELEESPDEISALERAGLIKSPWDVQMSRATIIVDIDRDDDALLASFKPKCRYNIRLAARHGVEVKAVPMSAANIDIMYSLMAATQQRAGFVLRGKRYFREYWELQEASGQGQLFFASWHAEILAGLYATFLGTRGWYKDGGSTKEHSDMMASHLLQWEVMRWLRDRGVRSYDLVAVPPSSNLTESHPLYGVYRFKSGFSEAITDFVGTWDLPLRPRTYRAWQRFGERAAQRLIWRLHHDFMY